MKHKKQKSILKMKEKEEKRNAKYFISQPEAYWQAN